MAFSLKLEGRDEADRVLWTADHLTWWPERLLMQDPRFERRYGDGYLDYVARLSIDEAIELEQRYRAKGEPHWQTSVNELFEKLANAAPETHVVVATIYEWESGL